MLTEEEKEENTVTRKIKMDHGYSFNICLPKDWMRKLGWLMAKELKLEIEKHPTNPLLDNIKIRLVNPKELKK